MQVCILTKYLGALWAGKILSDWGCKVTLASPDSHTQIIIADTASVSQVPNIGLQIILTDLHISSPHLLALSTALSTFGQNPQQIFVPNLITQTVVSNALAILVLQHLYNTKYTQQPQQPQQHTLSVVTILKYFGAFNISAKHNGLLEKPRGLSLLSGGAPFYSIYPCKSGQLAVGNLQPKFYEQMVEGLPLSGQQKQFWKENQVNEEEWPRMRNMLAQQFAARTAKEWEQHYLSYDTCITQIKMPFESAVREPKFYPLSPKL